MAYKKVVVPLDGSKLAEVVLPHVEEIATNCHINTIELVTVTENLKVDVPRSAEPVESFKQRLAVGDVISGRIYRADSVALLKVPLNVGKWRRQAEITS